MCMYMQADKPSSAMSCHRGGRGYRKNDQQGYEREQEKPATPTISDRPPMRSADQERQALPVTSDEKGPVSIARRRRGHSRPLPFVIAAIWGPVGGENPVSYGQIAASLPLALFPEMLPCNRARRGWSPRSVIGMSRYSIPAAPASRTSL